MTKERRLGSAHQDEVHQQGHAHGISTDADARYLTMALTLIVGFMLVEVTAAVVSGSLALLADAGHMLTDAGALGLSIWAARLSARPAVGMWTYGFKRAEILSAAVNGVTLLVVAVLVAFESIQRLVHPTTVEGGVVVGIAVLGVAVNVTAASALAKANRSNLNAFIATVVAGVVIIITGFQRADAVASLVVVALMLKAAGGLLRSSGRILLEAAPDNVDLGDVLAHLLATGDVCDVHDLHAWTVSSNLPALSAHVVINDSCFTDGQSPRILDELQACLVGHFDVEHSTFQLEPVGHLDHETGVH